MLHYVVLKRSPHANLHFTFAHPVLKLDDVRFLIDRCDLHFEAKFNSYLTTIGASARTKAATRY